MLDNNALLPSYCHDAIEGIWGRSLAWMMGFYGMYGGGGWCGFYAYGSSEVSDVVSPFNGVAEDIEPAVATGRAIIHDDIAPGREEGEGSCRTVALDAVGAIAEGGRWIEDFLVVAVVVYGHLEG